MRALVCVQVEGRLRYYLGDSASGELDEVAVIKSAGLDAATIARLGFSLLHEAGLNGDRPASTPRQTRAPRASATHVKRGERAAQALAYLERHPDSSNVDLARALGMTSGNIYTLMQNLHRDGRVTRREVQNSTGRPKHLWSLPPTR